MALFMRLTVSIDDLSGSPVLASGVCIADSFRNISSPATKIVRLVVQFPGRELPAVSLPPKQFAYLDGSTTPGTGSSAIAETVHAAVHPRNASRHPAGKPAAYP